MTENNFPDQLQTCTPNKDVVNILLSADLILPDSHIQLLSKSNGIAAYGGYFRLFGVGPKNEHCLIRWNEGEQWKFAWQGRCDGYLCFGSTAWGDQYAYKLGTLKTSDSSPVFLLDAYSMDSEQIAESFDEFWQKEFLRNAIDPYDDLAKACRDKLGDLSWDEFLIYNPPLQLWGTEDVDTVSKMSPRAVMIVNGDITLQLSKLEDDKEITGITTISDKYGRTRVQLQTSN